jgi:signal transduction histidine kinase
VSEREHKPDFRVLFEAAPRRCLVLNPDLDIVAVSDAYLETTMTRREDVVGRHILEVFPENPGDTQGRNVQKIGDSIWRVLLTHTADFLPAQKYDIRRPVSEGGEYEERYWNVHNAPVLGPDGQVVYVIHQVEDVTEVVYAAQEAKLQRQAAEVMRTQLSDMELEVVRALHDASDRERIARDLHDLVIQRVFGVGMRLSCIVPSVDHDTSGKLRHVVAELDAVISDIRNTIFDLQSPMAASRGLRSGVLSLANDATDRLGFQARVHFDGPIDTVVDRERGDQLLAVLREALSNVIRHAHAESVDVDITAGADLVLRVTDDGVGMGDDPAVTRPGKGLRNMEARAECLGGTCSVGSRGPRGTLVEWRVPLCATTSATSATPAASVPSEPAIKG